MAGTGFNDTGKTGGVSPQGAPWHRSVRPGGGRTDALSAFPATHQKIRQNAGELKFVTILFADIVDSSSLVSGRDPEDANEILQAVLKVFRDCVHRYRGTVSQMLGDGLLAAFGAPAALEDHALRACLAAQDMLSSAASDHSDGPAFRLRVGIASGDVYAHVEENGLWTDYRMVGECVHTAAKLQQRAEPNQALLARETLDLVSIGVTARPAGLFQLGTSAPPMQTFVLEGARATRRTAMDLLSSAEAPFVGREPELSILSSALQGAGNGNGSFVLLAGEAGIGKSRLVGELVRRSVSRFGCLHWPQAPMRRLGDPNDLEAVAQSLAAFAEEQAGGNGPAYVIAAAQEGSGALAGAAVSELFGIRATDPTWQSISPVHRADVAIEGLVAAITELSVDRPLLILAEDVHWVDTLTGRLLNALAGTVGGKRILVLATTRPQGSGEWKAPEQARILALEPLDSAQVETFLKHWLGNHPSVAGLKAQVAAKSQGMPLYLEESLRALASAGAIVGSPGAFERGDAKVEPELPPSVHGLLASRIDVLDENARRTLMTAAVIGPSVDLALLRRLGPVPSEALDATVAELEETGFLSAGRLLPNREYVFRHALIQEVAYGTITKRERRTLHTRILHALCDRRDHNLPSRTDLMAHHAFMAENWQAAYVYGRRAGQRAEGRSKLLEAQANYEKALAAIERMEPTRRNTLRRIDLSIALPRALLPRGLTDVHTHLNRARELATGYGDPVRYARSSSMLASFLWAFGELDDGIRLCQEGLAALDRQNDQETRIQLLMRLGGILADKGLFIEARDALRKGTALMPGDHAFRRYGLATGAEIHAHSVAGRSLAELGSMPEALREAVQAVDMAEEAAHAFTKVYAQAHLGWTLLIGEQFEQSVPIFEEALARCKAIRSTLWKPLLLGGLGLATVALGKHDRGLEYFERSFEIFRQQGFGKNTLHPRVSLAQVQIWHSDALLRSGRTAEALTAALDALTIAENTAQLVYQARALAFIGRAALRTDSSRIDAAGAFHRAYVLSRQLSMSVLAEQCAERLKSLDARSKPRSHGANVLSG